MFHVASSDVWIFLFFCSKVKPLSENEANGNRSVREREKKKVLINNWIISSSLTIDSPLFEPLRIEPKFNSFSSPATFFVASHHQQKNEPFAKIRKDAC